MGTTSIRRRVTAAIGALLAAGLGTLCLVPLRAQALDSGRPQAAAPRAYLGGTRAAGRVAAIYIKVGERVFLQAGEAPRTLREGAELWADVEFPEPLAGDTASARALLPQGVAAAEVGDVVEIRFAHKDNPRYFPVKEVTQVTGFIAHRYERLAADFERRIRARDRHDASPPQRLAQSALAASGAGHAR